MPVVIGASPDLEVPATTEILFTLTKSVNAAPFLFTTCTLEVAGAGVLKLPPKYNTTFCPEPVRAKASADLSLFKVIPVVALPI